MEIKDKVAVVTGGASGIGLSICKLFASKGAKVVVADIQGVDEAVEGLKAAGGTAAGKVCNVAKEDDVVALMQFAVDTFGGLDVAVANAGILRDGLLLKVDRETKKVAATLTLDKWQQVIDVNLTGVFLTGREAAKQMVNLGTGGVMILMSSISREGNFGQTNYSAAKAGVASMAVAWSKELARFKIRVNSIAPGFIGTPMVLKDMKPEALEKFKKIIPIGRLGEPEEIAQTAAYIVDCDLVTGVCVEATGGMRL
ncbi:MAG: SDR family oxidoreductase [Deltaproteobacteria bacterium]|nr:SDR family oxidoreductase [Deltaproteobacteria bacterium]